MCFLLACVAGISEKGKLEAGRGKVGTFSPPVSTLACHAGYSFFGSFGISGNFKIQSNPDNSNPR